MHNCFKYFVTVDEHYLTQSEQQPAALHTAASPRSAAWLFLPLGFEFIPEHPDFNPLNIALLFFLGMGGWRLFKAWGDWTRMQRQGRLSIELDPPGEVRHGRTLRGRIVFERPLSVIGEVRVALQYMETHRITEVGESEGRKHSREFMVWEDAFKLSVPCRAWRCRSSSGCRKVSARAVRGARASAAPRWASSMARARPPG